MQKPELLSPAGDRERLEAAIRYGADAVYLGSVSFGMRAGAAVFGPEELKNAVDYAHARSVRVYLTCNTLPDNTQAAGLPAFLCMARDCGVDALIVADIGIFMLARRLVPEVPVHISTQAGVVNFLTASELYTLGAARVVLARELSLEEIRYIREHTPPQLELEAFVHGAMCMSFSGRCLLSNYFSHRDANRGACTQPCRWAYHLMEEKRPGQYFPVFEDESGSYILNAQDLCMLEHLDALRDAGVTSMKIEGRMKSAYYTAVVTNAYRGALDALLHTPAGERFEPPPWTREEVLKVSHREYSTGFYLGRPEQCYQNAGYVRNWEVIAVVEGWRDNLLEVSERNKFMCGCEAEAMAPCRAPVPLTIRKIIDLEDGEVDCARHPLRRYLLDCGTGPLPVGTMIRRAVLTSENE